MNQYDPRDSFYKTPFGAVSTGTTVHFRIITPPDLYINKAMLVLSVNGTEQIIPFRYETTTQTYNSFTLAFAPAEAGTAFYHFMLDTEHGPKAIRAFAHGKGFMTDDPNAGGRFQLTVFEDGFSAPAGWQGGILYQIFPDRFYRSGKQHSGVPGDRILRTDWGGMPQFLPDENGQVRNNDYFGGDLAGITEKLPYLKELGVTALYLNPIFEAHSNHRYNTADYLKIDPMLGTEEDFAILCGEAKRLGIRIILDGVFSHTGSDSIYFNANSRNPSRGAANSENSPYYQS